MPWKPLKGRISANIIYSADVLMLVTIDLKHNNALVKIINNIHNSKCSLFGEIIIYQI